MGLRWVPSICASPTSRADQLLGIRDSHAMWPLLPFHFRGTKIPSADSSPLPPPSLQYLGYVEVEESRGMQVCEEAVKKLKAVRVQLARRGLMPKESSGQTRGCAPVWGPEQWESKGHFAASSFL